MQAIATISYNPKQLVKFLFSSHQCLLPSNLVLECLGWNWQNSVKTFNVKFTQTTKFIYQSLSILIPISFANGRRSIQTQYPVSSYFCRYQSLSHSQPHENFGSCFLIFGNCGVTPHRLYHHSLNSMYLLLCYKIYNNKWRKRLLFARINLYHIVN